MSRIGKLPIDVPSGVTITVDSGVVKVAGPKGELSQPVLKGLKVEQADNKFTVTRVNDEPKNRANHGLMRTLVNNMVVGVSQGFSKTLEVNGVGFKVNLAGQDLKMSLGYSHEVVYHLPEGVSASVEQNKITVSGYNKQQVGQAAAEIRMLRPPEPYKGKGIKYADERIIRKSGKSGKE